MFHKLKCEAAALLQTLPERMIVGFANVLRFAVAFSNSFLWLRFFKMAYNVRGYET
jgi:hypothetical protein